MSYTSSERRKKEYDYQIKNLEYNQNKLIKRIQIQKVHRSKQLNVDKINDTSIIRTNEIIGLYNKINRCRKMLSLDELRCLNELPNKPVPRLMAIALRDEDIPETLRKKLEFSPPSNGTLWSKEKIILREWIKEGKYSLRV